MTTKDKGRKWIFLMGITLFFVWTGYMFLMAGWMLQFWVSVFGAVIFPYSLFNII